MSALGRDEIARRVTALAPWFHNLDLGGVPTAPDHFLGDYPAIVWRLLAPALPADLSGRTVLDVGCNAGYFALELKRRGAARVVGIDWDPRYLAQARLAAEVSGLELELHQLSVFDVARLGERFDVVIFMGVLYHLRHPLLALDLLREHAVGELLVFQSMLRGSPGRFPVARPELFDAVVADDAGAVREIQVKAAAPRTSWIGGAFKLDGAILAELHALWRERGEVDAYVGTLVNAWLARGGRARAVRAGEAYVDVGTLHGYHEALALLRARASGTEVVGTP